jgi:DNA helicase-2/ATP-dependent DNA helicase PcrA
LSDIALSEGFRGESIIKNSDKPNESLSLSTIHQAKGLEWKVVFVIGLTEGQFPHAKVFEFPDQLEEERRLFYVSTTRAQDQLYLTHPMMVGRGDILARVSRFVTEIPRDTYEVWDVEKTSNSKTDDNEVSYVDEDSGSILDIYLKDHRS